MAFEELAPLASGRKRNSTIRTSVVASNGSRWVNIFIPKSLLSKVGSDDKVAVRVGTGVDANILQLRMGDGYKLTTPGRSAGYYLRIAATRLPLVNQTKSSPRDCEHWIKDGALYIRLPEEILIRETKAA